MSVLITGGLGYIGSHIALELMNQGLFDVVIIDNLSNSKIEKLNKIETLNKKRKHFFFHEVELLDYNKLVDVFSKYKIKIVIHMSGLKSVNESIKDPILYYDNNLISTLNLIKVMNEFSCKNLIFSSSATVYGNQEAPIHEMNLTGVNITNPYGKTKYIQEEILKDLYNSDNSWNIIILRYFNPIGHKHELLKEDPNGIPNNLFPYILKVHNKELPILNIYGNDYDTRDGTCIRDFIHVEDLSLGHVKACEYIENNENASLKIYNLGSGNGISVLELVNAFEKVNDCKINYKFTERREGDLSESFSDCSKANKELNWKTKKTLDELVKL